MPTRVGVNSPPRRGFFLLTWPDPPWDALLYGGMRFPAFDLVFRPPAHDELTPIEAPGGS